LKNVSPEAIDVYSKERFQQLFKRVSKVLESQLVIAIEELDMRRATEIIGTLKLVPIGYQTNVLKLLFEGILLNLRKERASKSSLYNKVALKEFNRNFNDFFKDMMSFV
jgi:hypothetical protein